MCELTKERVVDAGQLQRPAEPMDGSAAMFARGKEGLESNRRLKLKEKQKVGWRCLQLAQVKQVGRMHATGGWQLVLLRREYNTRSSVVLTGSLYGI